MKLKNLAILALVCVNLQAQETAASDEAIAANAPSKITISEAVEMAIKNNLSLESERLTLTARRQFSDMSWNQFIPTVDVGGALLRFNNTPSGIGDMLEPLFGAMGMPLPPGTFPAQPQWRLAGSLTIALNFNFAMIEEMNRLRLDYEKGLVSFERAKSQLERDVRKSYHNMLLLQENIALLRGSYANMERQVQMAQANYNAGLAPELFLLQARVARENMRPVIDQVENGLRLSMAQFAMFLGLPYDTEFELVAETNTNIFIPLDASEIISMSTGGRPEILELRQDILSLNSIRKSTWYRLYTPTLSLSWNADPTFSGDPWKDSWFNSGSWNQSQGMFRIALGFRLNGLFPFTPENQNIKTLDHQLTLLNMGLAQMVNGTQIEVYNNVLSLERTRLNAQAQAQTVSLAEQSYRLTEEAYRAGLQDYFQVQNAEQSLRQARVQLLEQQFNYLNGIIDLEYSIGVPFGTLSTRRGQ